MSWMLRNRLLPMGKMLYHAFPVEEFWKEIEFAADGATALKVTLEL